MVTMTDQKVRLPEVRVNGNRFTVVGEGPQEKPVSSGVRRDAAASTTADTVPEEKTGIIPSHVWG